MGGEFETASNAAVTSICTFSRGFILGNDEGMLALWEKTDNNEMDDSVV